MYSHVYTNTTMSVMTSISHYDDVQAGGRGQGPAGGRAGEGEREREMEEWERETGCRHCPRHHSCPCCPRPSTGERERKMEEGEREGEGEGEWEWEGEWEGEWEEAGIPAAPSQSFVFLLLVRASFFRFLHGHHECSGSGASTPSLVLPETLRPTPPQQRAPPTVSAFIVVSWCIGAYIIPFASIVYTACIDSVQEMHGLDASLKHPPSA